MAVTIKVDGAAEKIYTYNAFPTAKELARLNFRGSYRNLQRFEDKLEFLRKNAKENVNEGSIKFTAVLRKGIITVVVDNGFYLD